MTIMKLKFINSLNDERKKSTVETTVTEMMIFESQELLINVKAKINLNLMKVMMKIMK